MSFFCAALCRITSIQFDIHRIKDARTFLSLFEVESDQNSPVLCQLELLKLFLYAKYHNNERIFIS